MPEISADGLVIVQISSRHVAATVAWRSHDQPEKVLAHKVVYCHWYELALRGRKQALSEAVHEACAAAGIQPLSVFVAISDAGLQANFAIGSVDCTEEVPFGESDCQLALTRATHQAIPSDREVVHVLPQRWEIRDEEGERVVDDPRQELGSRLTCHVLLVTLPVRVRQELSELLRACDLELEALIAPPVALHRGMSGMFSRTGVNVVIDCGARHTSLVVHRKGRLVHLETHPFGGDHCTQLLCQTYALDPGRAEQLKQDIDVSDPHPPGSDVVGQTYLWRDVQERDRLLAPCSAAVRELLLTFFKGLADNLSRRDLLPQKGRINLVGRASNVQGFTRLLQEVFGLPAVQGSGRKDRDPSAELVDILTTGLVRCAAQERERLLRRRDVAGLHQARRVLSGFRAWLFQPLR